ncbi:uncharacterized protein LOC126378147 [Pectinophora gossypiella]|uniref:uncharacterized protein LOC126378147 n=1 Tax=Pectinophora gossypiella TaxID=13191 RepID=UPI00214DF143|nr:uncharacterized protein LOC126378147 [Pectinophora gossypiella]
MENFNITTFDNERFEITTMSKVLTIVQNVTVSIYETINETVNETLLNENRTEVPSLEDEEDDIGHNEEFYNSTCNVLNECSPLILYLGLLPLLLCLIIFVIFNCKFCKLSNYVYNFFSMQHGIFGLLHLFCLPLAYSNDLCDSSFSYILFYFELILPLWTLAFASIVFLQIFLFGLNVNIYTRKELTSFGHVSTSIVLFYNEIVNFLVEQDVLSLSIRFTSEFLIMCVPIMILSLVIINMFQKPKIPLYICSFIVSQLLIFILSDILLVWFNIAFYYKKRPVKLEILASLLCLRLVVEGCWFLFSNAFITRFISKCPEDDDVSVDTIDMSDITHREHTRV